MTGRAGRGVAEQMIVAMARLLRDGETAFHGVASVLPMLAINLARRLHAPGLIYLNIAGGVDPTPGPLPHSSTDPELARGSASIFSNEDFYDLCARGGIDVAFLGATQIDPFGRTNNSVIGPYERPKVRLPGGGGAAVVLPTARRVIVWRTVHSRRVFVERLDFVTGAGNLDRVVTPLCVFRRQEGRLAVESIHPGHTREEVLEQTGFPLDIAADVPTTPPPTPEELRVIEQIDPRGVRYLEFES